MGDLFVLANQKVHYHFLIVFDHLLDYNRLLPSANIIGFTIKQALSKSFM